MISTFTQPQTQKCGFGNISICYLAEATVFQDIYRNLEQQISCEVHSDLLKGHVGLIFPASRGFNQTTCCPLTLPSTFSNYVAAFPMFNFQFFHHRHDVSEPATKEHSTANEEINPADYVYGVRFDVLVESEKEIQDSILVRCYSKKEIN